MKQYLITEEQLKQIVKQKSPFDSVDSILINTKKGKREIKIVTSFIQDVNNALKGWVKDFGEECGVSKIEILIPNLGEVGAYQIEVRSAIISEKN